MNLTYFLYSSFCIVHYRNSKSTFRMNFPRAATQAMTTKPFRPSISITCAPSARKIIGSSSISDAIITVSPPSSRAAKTNACISPFPTCAISRTNGTGTSSSVPQRTNRTTAAASTTTQRLKPCPRKPRNFWTIFHFKENDNEIKS